jgi:hypothetical protein
MKTIHKQAAKKTSLRFSPTAWAKLLFLRDAGDTEIGAFGITPADDLLYVEEICLVKQTCTWMTVAFDDESVADFFDDQVDAARRPEQFARIWVHTHPGDSPQPSTTDEQTFTRVFGGSNWALMFILARGGQTYARLRFHVGPGGDVLLPVDVDFSREFDASDFAVWKHEYSANISVPPPEPAKVTTAEPKFAGIRVDDEFVDNWWRDAWDEYADFERLPMEEPYGYVRDF